MRHSARILAVLLLTFAACQNAQAERRRAPKAAHVAAAANSAEPDRVRATNDVGLYRWFSGMQMGIFWAGVLNNRHERLGFSAHNEEGRPVGWEPDIDLADKKLPGEEGMLNLVVGGKSVTFNYTVEEGRPNIEPLASDGSDNTSVALHLISGAAGKPVCLEFPDIGYITCFSTKGATRAMKPDAWLP